MLVFRSNSSLKETAMVFKEYDKEPTFLDMEIQRAVTHSRNQQVLSEIDAVINWDPIEKIVQENYPVGQSDFGNKAYPPIILLKAILIQKWFGIKSDPDLESQVNDRFSFKAFIGLPFSEPSPDHSIITWYLRESSASLKNGCTVHAILSCRSKDTNCKQHTRDEAPR
jgi:Transposase domain (DUF772)